MAYIDITDKEALITELQKMLRALSIRTNDKNLETGINGIYNEGTKKAVAYFQKKHMLPSTGKADLDTWTLLRDLYRRQTELNESARGITPFPDAAGYAVKPGERSDLVLIIQLMLNELRRSYDSYGHIPPNGRYDITTSDAVREFQRATGLDPSGSIDRTTWNLMAQEYNDLVRRDG